MAFRGLFIGVDRFHSNKIKWLSCAARDARALHALFTDTLGGGGTLLTDKLATRTAIESEFHALATCGEDDVVVVSFSGHGSTTHELVTYDADPSDLSRTAIPLDTLAEWFSRIPARVVVCVLDCCFSGGLGAKVFVSESASRSIDTADSLVERISGKGRVVLTAATANQEAWENGRYRHGLLTHHLLRALQGAEEVVSAGKIHIYKLLEFVTRKVSADAATMGKLQEPTLRGQIDGELTWPVFSPGDLYKAEFPGRCTQPVTADVSSLSPYGFPPELVKAWAGAIPSLNELQIDAINQFGLLNGDHLVVSAPTSSGKTMIGELAALRGVLERKRACFLLPLKALVNDKHRHFIRTYGAFGLRVIRATGDISDDIPALMKGQYDVCLLTYEKFSSLAIAAPHILEQLGTVVVDEVQMIADASRGANLEFLLTLLRLKRESGVEPQLVALSAVIGDTNGLEDWLGGRLLRRTERPVPLEEGLLLADGRFRFLDASGQEQYVGPIIAREYRKNSSQDWIVPLVRKLVAEGKQVIVFRETKGEARGCAGYLANALALAPAQSALDRLPKGDPSVASSALREALRKGVAFHNADLDRDERMVVEEEFRATNSAVRVIAATTTLAMGVNTPAEAVVVAGLMHPDDNPYSVAEYKNIIGRAGRLGFSNKGTSYLLALSDQEERQCWDNYVKATPEDVSSRFVARDTDPRTLILRVLAAARHTGVKGIAADDIVKFLEASFGAFQNRQAKGQWSWDRGALLSALADLKQHRLVETDNTEHFHLTSLGRFAGEAGVEVESIIRLVATLGTVRPGDITDPALLVATQMTVELDQLYFPLNKRSTQKEPQTWFGTLREQGVSQNLLSALARYVPDKNTATLRAKKATACLFWISMTTMAEIEASLTQHGGSFDGAAGPVRSVASRTADLLSSVVEVATFLHPGIDLADRMSRLLVRLELGVPFAAVPIAAELGTRLTRGDYQALVRADLASVDALDRAADDAILRCVENDQGKLKVLRDFVASSKAAPPAMVAPTLPPYEG